MVSGAEIFVVTVSLLTALANAYATWSNNKTTDKLADSVSNQTEVLSQKWDDVNSKFERSQKQVDRFIELLGEQLEAR